MSESTPKYTREQMISKISKLLELANDPACNEHLAAQAAAKAQTLMLQWAIDEATVAGSTNAEPFVTVKVPYLKDKPAKWEDYLVATIAKAMMCHSFRGDKSRMWSFAGYARDVEIASYMFAQVRAVLESMSRKRLAEHAVDMKTKYGRSIYNVAGARDLGNCHPTVYRQRWLDSWLLGAERGVASALVTQKRTTAPDDSQALVIVTDRLARATEWSKDANKIGDGGGRKYRSQLVFSGARDQGIEDGKAIQLRKGLTTDDQKMDAIDGPK